MIGDIVFYVLLMVLTTLVGYLMAPWEGGVAGFVLSVIAVIVCLLEKRRDYYRGV